MFITIISARGIKSYHHDKGKEKKKSNYQNVACKEAKNFSLWYENLLEHENCSLHLPKFKK